MHPPPSCTHASISHFTQCLTWVQLDVPCPFFTLCCFGMRHMAEYTCCSDPGNTCTLHLVPCADQGRTPAVEGAPAVTQSLSPHQRVSVSLCSPFMSCYTGLWFLVSVFVFLKSKRKGTSIGLFKYECKCASFVFLMFRCRYCGVDEANFRVVFK